MIPRKGELSEHWGLDDETVFLNHGSFGAAPVAVLEEQDRIRKLMERDPVKNCIVAFSLSPQKISDILDNKAPSVARRITVLQQLSKQGWSVGLRFDPLIYCSDWENLYSELIADIMEGIDPANLHSVSHGPLRFPKEMHKQIVSLHPDNRLFSFPMEKKGGIISYGPEIEDLMSNFLQTELNKYTTQNKIFRCTV